MNLIQSLKHLNRQRWSYDPMVKINIFGANLIHNLNQFQNQYPKLLFAPVLKSNAYGHGLSLVASLLDKQNIAFLVVDSLFEAKIIRQNAIKSAILIIGFTTPSNIIQNKIKGVTFTITSLDQLSQLAKTLKHSIKLHLKIDTGMYRQGLLPAELNTAIKLIIQNKNLRLTGLCSHLADADSSTRTHTEQQILIWNEAVKLFKDAFKNIEFLHIAATAGVAYSQQIISNTARLGAGLYGLERSPFQKLNLKPALELQTIIGSIKTIPSGESVGYNATFTTIRPTVLATIPVGYYEGIDRRLSNKGLVQVKGVDCPIIGRVSMNITTIDITNVPNVRIGDNVIVISHELKSANSVEEIAKLIDTVPHEILVHLPESLHRELV